MSPAFAREHAERLETGRAMLALWSAGVLATLDAMRNGDQEELARLERNARHALKAAKR